MEQSLRPERGCLLVKGPSGVGKLEYCVDLAEGFLESGEPVIFVTVDSPPERIRGTFQRFGLNPRNLEGDRLVFVDCHSAVLGEAPNTASGRRTLYLSSLANLEQIAMHVGKASSWFDSPAKVIFHSLSPLFFHNSPQTMAKFFQVLTAQVRGCSSLAIYALHDGVHDESTVRTLEMFVDGVIEMRFDENLRREMRVHHMQGITANPHWVSFQVEDSFIVDSDALVLERRLSDSVRESSDGMGRNLFVEQVRPHGRPSPG